MLPFSTNTVTIYNKLETENPDTFKTERHWFRTVLHGCSWGRSAQSVLVGEVKIQSDEIQVQVPESADYLPVWKWEALSLEDAATHWTGKAETVLVLGEVDDVIEMNGTDTKLVSKYEGRVFRAQHFVDNTGDGFPLGHYVFRG